LVLLCGVAVFVGRAYYEANILGIRKDDLFFAAAHSTLAPVYWLSALTLYISTVWAPAMLVWIAIRRGAWLNQVGLELALAVMTLYGWHLVT
jgi:hypothetical protein